MVRIPSPPRCEGDGMEAIGSSEVSLGILKNYNPSENEILRIITERRITRECKSAVLDNCTSDLQGTMSVISNRRCGGARLKEPKFVPYEPYKGCVRPIMPYDKKKKVNCISVGVGSEEGKENGDKHHEDELQKKVKMLEKVIEELQIEIKRIKEETIDLKAENKELDNQLNMQTEVNAELKKLLVASVGEDIQSRVHLLTEDKALLATRIRQYSDMVSQDCEEKEKLAIQCDVWRSKFLASSLMVEELSQWKAVLCRRYHDLETGAKMMIDEHKTCVETLLSNFRILKNLKDAFDPMNPYQTNKLSVSGDILSLSQGNLTIGRMLKTRLLGDMVRPEESDGLKVDALTGTEAEKAVSKILCEPPVLILAKEGKICQGHYKEGRPMVERFHPHTNYDLNNLTCCGQCSGEIKVV